MEKTDKSAEEILDKIDRDDYGNYYYSQIIVAMHEYAAQQLSEYKERLKTEMNKFRSGMHAVGIDYLIELIDKLQPTPSSVSEYKEYFELADRAKQVLRDKGYGWTGLDILETCKLVPNNDSNETM